MNATDFNNAADVLRREAKRFEQLSAAAAVLDEAGAILSRVQEAEKTLSDLNERHTQVLNDVAAMEHSEREAIERIAQMNEEARVGIDANLNAAKAQAAKIIADAEALAASKIEESTRRAENMVSEARSSVAVAEAEKHAKVDAMRGLDEEIAAKSQELAKIEANIRAAREKIAAFAG